MAPPSTPLWPPMGPTWPRKCHFIPRVGLIVREATILRSHDQLNTIAFKVFFKTFGSVIGHYFTL